MDALGDADSGQRATELIKIHCSRLLTIAGDYATEHPTRPIVGVIFEADSPVTDLLRDVRPSRVGPSGSVGVLPQTLAVQVLRRFTYARAGVNWLAPAASVSLRTLPVLIAMRGCMKVRAIVYRMPS